MVQESSNKQLLKGYIEKKPHKNLMYENMLNS